MTWLQRYRFRNFVRSSLWLAPFTAGLGAIVCQRLLWEFDKIAQWSLLGYSLESARAVVGAINSAMLTFVVFLMSMIFVALQVAVGQLTPRIIAFAFRYRSIKGCLGIFMFTYMFSMAAQGRLGSPVPQLVVAVTILLSMVSIAAFLYFVDRMGKALRPVSISAELAELGTELIESIYPALLSSEKPALQLPFAVEFGAVSGTVTHAGRSGMLLAFDAEGLTRLAARHDCLIRLVPQVGDFVPTGDPLFSIHGGDGSINHDELRQRVAFGVERTVEQDPEFVFRIIVDIAIKALSPAINDPTTAISCMNQLQRLLHRVGLRDLGDGRLKDAAGRIRVSFPTPDWEDYVQLAVRETLQYGGNSLQVVRRLRALLDDLLEKLPEQRAAELLAHRELLERTVARNFIDPVERELALSGDYKGVGGTRR